MIPNNQRIDATAAEWAVRLHERALSADEEIKLEEWLSVDTRHRGALLRARAVWADLDRLAALAGRPKTPGSPGGIETLTKSPERDASTLPFNNQRRRLIVSGVTAALFGIAGAWWLEQRNQTYVSRIGEIRRVTLSDGSHIVLNTASEAIVRFDKAQREIELAAGEGIFEVSKDPLRPFVVRTGPVSVRAIGTVFAVRSTDQRVDVTVTEGTVEILENGAVMRRVTANEHATVMETRDVQVQSIPQGEADRRLAWRHGEVDFAGETLETAVQEINRHNRRRIVIDDTALASRPVVGVFRADDPDGFAETVAAALGAHSVDLNDTVHLQSGSAP